MATRDCQVCLKYIFDESSGRMLTGRDGRPELRHLGSPAPCRTSEGCLKGTAEKNRSLNPMNELCYQHYLECRAVGHFPDEPVVRRNAAIIRDIEDRVQQFRNDDLQRTIIQLSVMK